MKIRLGMAAAAGCSLQRLGIVSFAPAFGGRWNAGSNKRGDGTDIAPADYAANIADELERC